MEFTSTELATAIVGFCVVLGSVAMLFSRLGWLSFGKQEKDQEPRGCPDGQCRRTVTQLEERCQSLARRVIELEGFKDQVIIPNVGMAMCKKTHERIDEAMAFFMANQKEQLQQIRNDHDVITEIRAELKNINKKLDETNSRSTLHKPSTL
jgi:hypothetical protein